MAIFRVGKTGHPITKTIFPKTPKDLLIGCWGYASLITSRSSTEMASRPKMNKIPLQVLCGRTFGDFHKSSNSRQNVVKKSSAGCPRGPRTSCRGLFDYLLKTFGRLLKIAESAAAEDLQRTFIHFGDTISVEEPEVIRRETKPQKTSIFCDNITASSSSTDMASLK